MPRIVPLLGALVALSVLVFAPAAARAGLRSGYVGCSTSNDVYPFDPVTLAEGAQIDLMPSPAWYPYDATITPDGTEVWLVGASGDEIAIIDRATDTIVSRIPVGEYPVSIEFSLDGSLAFVGSRDFSRLDVVDTATRTVISSLPLPDQAGQIGVDPRTGLLYVAAWYDGELWEISADGTALLRTLLIGSSLWSVRVAPECPVIYVTDRGDDRVRVVDIPSLTERTSVAVGDDPWGLDISKDGLTLVVTCEDSSEVRVIDTRDLSQVAIALDPDSDPRDVDIHEGRGEAFVAGGRVGPVASQEDPVYVLDLSTLTIVRSYDSLGSNTNVIAVWPPDPVDCGPDSDGDGVGDSCDRCPGQDDSQDLDADGKPDGCDSCPFDASNVDLDCDGVCEDGDGSGTAGDAPCVTNDARPAPGCDDNCPGLANPGDLDGDLDGSGDACDLCPGEDDRLDMDSDALPDGCDNCPDTFNPGQEDADGNGIGDACDSPGGCTDPPEASGLRVAREGSDVLLSFDPIDPARTDDTNLHVGSLAGLTAGDYDHAALACGLLGTDHRDVGAADGPDLYYLLAGHCLASGEGSYGTSSLAAERPSTGDLGTMSCP